MGAAGRPGMGAGTGMALGAGGGLLGGMLLGDMMGHHAGGGARPMHAHLFFVLSFQVTEEHESGMLVSNKRRSAGWCSVFCEWPLSCGVCF